MKKPHSFASSARFLRRDRRGASLAEMGILVGLVAIVSIGTVVSMGEEVRDTYCGASKALGADIECLDVAVSTPQDAPEGDGEGGPTPTSPRLVFADLALPSSETGTYTHLVAFEGGGETPASLSITPTSGSIAACIQASEGETPYCNPQRGLTDVIDIPAGTHAAGYQFETGDRYTPYEQDLSIVMSVEDVEVDRWDIHVSRAADAIEMNMTSAFDPVVYPMKTTGTQFVMTPLEGDFNTLMSLYVDAHEEVERACVQKSEGGAIDCVDYQLFDGSRRIEVPASAHAIGYRITLPGNTMRDYQHSVSGYLQSQEGSKPYAPFTQEVSRITEEATVSPAFAFENHVTTPGFTGTDYVMKELAGAVNADARVAVRPQGNELRVYPCYQMVEGGGYSCGEYKGSGYLTFIDAPQDAYAVGYRFDTTSGKWSDASINLEINLANVKNGDAKETWNISVTRPGETVVVAPTTTFDDIVLAADTSGAYTIMEVLEGEFNTPMNVTMDKGKNLVSTCRQLTTADAVDCNGIAMRTAYRSEVDKDTYRIGYRINLPAAGTAYDMTYQITLKSATDLSKSHSWTQRITRPAN